MDAVLIRNVVFALAGATVLVLKSHYSGPGEQFVIAHAGNVSVSFAMYFAVVSATRHWARPRLGAVCAALLAVTLFEVTDGFGVMANVFDPWDLAANAAGVGLAIAADTFTTRRVGRPGRRRQPESLLCATREESFVGRSIAICYFSGTGNTEYVIGLARDALARAGAHVDLFLIEDLLRGRGGAFEAASYDMLGIAHPVLGFDCPGFIYDFVRTLPHGDGKPVFILKTAGDYHSVNHSASRSIKRILSSEGYDPFYDEIVAMPSNWLTAYDDRLNRQLVEVAPQRVNAAVRRVLAGERRSPSNRWPARTFLKAVSYLEDRYGSKQFGRCLRAGASCTRCGRCARDCPSGNIQIGPNGVAFDNACVWCMRCIYNCPEKAIDNKYMNIFILKGGYSLARIRRLQFEPIDFGDSQLPFWHKYFRRYFED